MNDSTPKNACFTLRSSKAVSLHIVTAIIATFGLQITNAQTPPKDFAQEHAEMMEALLSEGPNSAPTTHVRIVGAAKHGTAGEFSFPAKIADAQCKSSKCEISARLNQATEIIDHEGETLDVHSLEQHRTYKAISVRFDDRGSGLIEQIMLKPKPGKAEQ